MKPIIDPEFQNLIPSLSKEEFDLLEKSIVKEGCRDPLTTWDGLLIDGHNRFAICEKHKISYQTKAMEFVDADAAKAWMLDNQLGRRNLKPDQFTLLLGQRYKLEKRQGERTDLTCGQNDHKSKTTAEKIGKQHGVSASTVKRAEKVLDAAEKLDKLEPGFKKKMMDGEAPAKSTIVEAAKVAESNPEKAKEILRGDVEGKKVINFPSLGMQYAALAISQLKKIDKRDGDRNEALDSVIDWIKNNR